jgi:hypothetical protein
MYQTEHDLHGELTFIRFKDPKGNIFGFDKLGRTRESVDCLYKCYPVEVMEVIQYNIMAGPNDVQLDNLLPFETMLRRLSWKPEDVNEDVLAHNQRVTRGFIEFIAQYYDERDNGFPDFFSDKQQFTYTVGKKKDEMDFMTNFSHNFFGSELAAIR